MPLYMCDGCWDEIPALKARIHCKECEDFDLCANCFVVGRFGKGHTKDHGTVLEERSGIQVSEDAKLKSPNKPSAEGSRSTSVAASLSKSSGKSSTNKTAKSKGKGKAKVRTTTQSPASGSTTSPAQSHGSSATRFSTPMLEVLETFPNQQTPIYPIEVPTGWKPLFHGTQPTQTMIDLLTAIFLCIDATGARLLTPEQYSNFLDIQGYLVEENVWKRNIKPQYGYNVEDIADFELRTSYENFSIDHVLQPRTSSVNADYPFQPTLSPISNGQMPMLSLRGFIDITTVETLGEPSVGWQRLNLAKNYFGVWMEWGDIPRSTVPDFPPQELLDRIAQISAFAQRQAVERTEARRLQSASFAQQGWNSQMGMDQSPTGYPYQ